MRSKVINDFRINYDGVNILSVEIEGIELRNIILTEMNSFNINYKYDRPLESTIQLPESMEKLSYKVFNVIKELNKDDQNGCLQAILATYYFDSFTIIRDELLKKGHHLFSIKIYENIIQFVLNWEASSEGCRIHKGSLYFFMAYTFLMYGDVDKGFIYMYNAIEDDKYLNLKCPRLNYPDEAPVYKTACLKDDKNNNMYPIVMEIRSSLKTYIDRYNIEFNRNLDLTKLDKDFFQNKSIEDIKYFFVYTYWKLYEIYFKIREELIDNDFSKLQSLDVFFNLCLILDKILQSNPKYGKDALGENITNICHKKKWLSVIDNESLRRHLNWKNDDIDVIIPKLLTMSTLPSGKSLSKEAKYLLIAWKLRNFGGHNINTQSILVKKFDELCKIILCCIFISIEEI
jgi:hypothetical protein